MKTLIILFSLLLIVLDALVDGLNYKKDIFKGHLLKAFLILCYLCTPLFISKEKLFLFVIAYTFIRFALFNYVFNWIAGLKWDYLSQVSIPDKWLLRVPVFHRLFMQFIIGFTGIAIFINEF